MAESQNNKPVILLVEDYKANILVAGFLLEGLGFDYDVAHDGQEAVGKITTLPHRYDAILMDVEMPILNGYEATRLIREHEMRSNHKRIPIIGVTAHISSEHRSKCLLSGMDDYIAKPFNSEELCQKMSNALAHLEGAA